MIRYELYEDENDDGDGDDDDSDDDDDDNGDDDDYEDGGDDGGDDDDHHQHHHRHYRNHHTKHNVSHYREIMMTSSNGNIFRVTGHLCGEFTGPRWIPRTKASDTELWCFLWSAPE